MPVIYLKDDPPWEGARGERASYKAAKAGRSSPLMWGGSRDAIKWAIQQEVHFVLLQEHR